MNRSDVNPSKANLINAILKTLRIAGKKSRPVVRV